MFARFRLPLRRVVLPALAALAASCKRSPPAPHAAAESPVPAPATLVAEGTLRDPDAFWGRLRKGRGGALAQMPETAAGALLAWAGEDPTLAPMVSGTTPFQVAVGETPRGLGVAIAMKLGDLRAVREALVEGDAAPYRGQEVDGMVRLLPRREAPERVALAVTWSGYLVVASSDAELTTLGAYAARTLPTVPPPASSFELRAAPAALDRAGKQAPSFAAAATGMLATVVGQLVPPEVDAHAFAACFTPTIQGALATASDLAEARLDADSTDAELKFVVTLAPKAGDNAARRRLASIRPAPLAPLLEAPREAAVALFWHDDAQARAQDATTLGPCVGRALAPVLGPGGATKLGDVAQLWARGRGDWQVASFVAKPGVAGLVLRAPVADAAAASDAVRGFAELTSQLSFADAIRRLLPLHAGQTASTQVAGLGKASVVMFPSHAPVSRGLDDSASEDAPLAPPGLAWVVNDKEVDLGMGQSPSELLTLTKPAMALGANGAAARALQALGTASFAAVVAPPGCCVGEGDQAAPLVLGWGTGREPAHLGARVTATIGDDLLGRIVAQLVTP